MICVPIVATTNQAAKADLKKAAAVADLAELRLDYLVEPPDVPFLLENAPLPVIVTNRPAREGGLFEGPEAERIAALKEAVAQRADYVDIEHDSVGLLGDSLGTRIIVSYHNWKETPADIADIARALAGTGADIVKIATAVAADSDIFTLARLPSTTGMPTIVVGMGPKGVPTRILAGKFGSYLTFAAFSQGRGSAPGQLTAAELKNIYNYNAIEAATTVYGVIGKPIGHSLSPHIHNAAFRALGEPAVYVPFEVDNLEGFLSGCASLDAAGFSVTIPHKEEAFRLAAETDEVTARIGALNTLRLENDSLRGTNTDWQAALESIRSALPEGENLAGKRVLLLGAGGAAKAILYGLASAGADVTLANRTFSRAQALAREVSCNVVPWDERTNVNPRIIANSTSLGMYPAVGTTPFPKQAFKAGQIVFDAVYNPRLTRLIEEARQAGCTVVDGLEMFVQQALAQLKFWSYDRAPVDILRKAALMGLESFASE